jgi:hypothetical protein
MSGIDGHTVDPHGEAAEEGDLDTARHVPVLPSGR